MSRTPTEEHPRMDQDWEAVAKAVKERRVELGMRQKDLATAAGLDASTIRNIETQARSRFEPLTLSRVSKALDRPSGWLQAVSEGTDLSEIPEGASGADATLDDLIAERDRIEQLIRQKLREP
jgi:transcriptional regulator with XRE-family HTH domain